MLVLDKITKVFNTEGVRKTILEDVSFSVPLGKSVALIGRNGAGKSSLMRIISGLINPTSGSIKTDKSVSWPVGFAGSFHGDMTGAQNARFVARVYGVPSNQVVAFVDDYAELGSELHNPVRTYSSGMRSRLAFAISMSIDFDFYLIDEVTSVGDANFRKKSADTLLEKVKTSGAIVVSHSPETLRQLCTSAVVIEKAKAYAFESVDGGFAFYNWCRMQYGEPAETAEKAYQNALATMKGTTHGVRVSDARVAQQLMHGLTERKEWDQALALAYVLVSDQRPGGAAPMVELARALRQEKDGRWVPLARAAIHTPDASADTHAFLTEAFIAQKEPPIEEIRAEINKMIAKDPQHPTILFAQANVHFLQGELDEAFRVVNHAMEVTPSVPRLAGLRKKIKDAMDAPLELTEIAD